MSEPFLPKTLFNDHDSISLPARLIDEYDDYAERTVLATTTKYGNAEGIQGDDALRAKLALSTFSAARHKGYRIVVVDGGSNPGWVAQAKGTGAFVVPERLEEFEGTHAIGKGRRQALTDAANLKGWDAIGWLEPEKHPYLNVMTMFQMSPYTFSPAAYLAAIVAEGEADIAIPRRVDDLASYPLQQRFMEISGNLTTMDMLRRHFIQNGMTPDEANARVPYLDMWIGPRMMNEKGLERFLSYKGEFGDRWESIFVPVWQGLLAGDTRVVSVPVWYEHPQAQTALESDLSAATPYDWKRRDQYVALTDSLDRLLKAS